MSGKSLTRYRKDEKLLVEGWQPPYIGGSFAEKVAEFTAACAGAQELTMTAQFYFSHFIREGDWALAEVWFDPLTAIEYDDESDIPVNCVVSARPRWVYQEEFVVWCQENVPGFSHQTYWARHAIIDKWCETGMKLPEAVRIVAGLKLRTPSKLVQRALDYNDDHTVGGVNWEVAENLPTLPAPVEELQELDTETQVRQVKQAAVEYMREKAEAKAEGVLSNKAASASIRRDLHKDPKISVYLGDLSKQLPYVIEARFFDKEASSYGEGEVEEIYIRFVTKDGEVLEDLPDRIRPWWRRKFKLEE